MEPIILNDKNDIECKYKNDIKLDEKSLKFGIICPHCKKDILKYKQCSQDFSYKIFHNTCQDERYICNTCGFSYILTPYLENNYYELKYFIDMINTVLIVCESDM